MNSIRTLNLAEVTYAETKHHAGYTCALSDLSSAGLLAPQLASGARSGYVLALENCTADAPGGPNVKYQVVAYPMTKNQTGVRAFCSDESGVIKFDVNGSPQACLESGSALQ